MAWASKPDVDRWFTCTPPTEGAAEKIRVLKEKARELAVLILDLTPACADQSASVRQLRESIMTASAAIALERPRRPAVAE